MPAKPTSQPYTHSNKIQCRYEPGFNPRSAGRFRVRISEAHAVRLISRPGKEGSTVPSVICDRWLILSSVALSY